MWSYNCKNMCNVAFPSVLSLTYASILVENGHITVKLTSQWNTGGKDLSAYILAIRGSPEHFDH